MRILSLEVTNFCSYPILSLDFTKESDLTLIYGATGSGKSTIMDALVWGLFGKTAKDGNSSDIRPFARADETKSCIRFRINETEYSISRRRGSINDLYWGDEKRGRDLNDTQSQINNLLGFDYDTFVTSAYFHEFNPTGDFFKANARDRRELFEKLARLEFPKTLAEKFTQQKKVIKNKYDKTNEEYQRLIGRCEGINQTYKDAVSASSRFDIKRAERIARRREEAESADSRREAQLKEIQETIDRADVVIAQGYAQTGVCSKCGQNTNLTEVHKHRAAVQTKASSLKLLSQINSSSVIKFEAEEPNPFLEQLKLLESDMATLESAKSQSKTSLDALGVDLSDFSYLYDLTSTLRSKLLKSTIKTIESKANSILFDYFDGEFSLELNLNDKDDLIVNIQKSGYSCTYKQLSKGQRQLLKLSFSIAVMEAASNKVGVHFSQLFFDEPCDGLDVNMKLKAFGLFQELSKNHSVYVIDHSEEFQNQFESKIHVTMKGEESSISEIN